METQKTCFLAGYVDVHYLRDIRQVAPLRMIGYSVRPPVELLVIIIIIIISDTMVAW